MGSGIAVDATLSRTGRRHASAGLLSAAPLRRTHRRHARVDANAQRRDLRQRLAERRRALSPQQRIAAAQGVRRSLEQLPEYHTDARVAGYWAVQGELALNLAIPPLLARGQQFLLPVLAHDRTLAFAPWTPGEPVAPNRYGIPEPATPERPLAPFQLDLVLVPVLGFDRYGQRLGYGGGWYDRSFAFLGEQARPTEPLLVGIAYDFQQVDTLPAEAWDIPLDFIATDRELIDCHAERTAETPP